MAGVALVAGFFTAIGFWMGGKVTDKIEETFLIEKPAIVEEVKEQWQK